MNYKLAQFTLNSTRNSASTADVFIAQVDSIKESLAGKLFVVVELENNRSLALKIINFLIDRLSHNYYQNEKLILRERMPTLLPEHIFEAALSKTNKHFQEFLKNEKLKFDFSQIHITVGLLYENKLHFTNFGKNKVLLIYREKQEGKNSEFKYKISDLGQDSYNPKQKEPKLFASVLSGRIPPDSSFLVANEALPEYLSQKQMFDIITTLPPASAAEQIKQTLSAINSYVAFLGVIIKRPQKSQEGAKAANIAPGQESISRLNRTEDATEELLAPSGILQLKKILLKLRSHSQDHDRQTRAAAQLSINQGIYAKKKSALILNKAKSLFSLISQGLAALGRLLAKLIANRSGWKQLPTRLGKALSSTWNRLRNWHAGLNIKGKILLYVALASMLILVYNISTRRQEQVVMEENRQYEELSQEIEKKQNQAEAHLLYSNEEGAQNLFTEIQALLDEFPQETGEQQARYQEFAQKFQLQLEKTQRVVRQDELPVLTDFSNLNSQAQSENIIYNPGNKQIYAGDSGQKSVYNLNISDQSATTITDLNPGLETLKFPAQNNSLIEFFSQQTITSLNTDNNTLNFKNLELITPADSLVAMSAYLGRIYLANEPGDQIYRYDLSAGSYGSPRAWLNESVDLLGTVDMNIDGTIFILKNDGQLWQFSRGARTEFKLESPDPALAQADALWVSPEQDRIYILDNREKRILEYDKDGQFRRQYKSNSFTDMRDISVDEEGGVIYVLNVNSVLAIDIEQNTETTN